MGSFPETCNDPKNLTVYALVLNGDNITFPFYALFAWIPSAAEFKRTFTLIPARH